MRQIDKLVRPHLKELKAYSSARDEFGGEAKAWLDANENAFGAILPEAQGIHRYPDPLQKETKAVIAAFKGVAADSLFLGNGSDEIIELLVRVFCEPKEDRIISLPPTFPMYAVAAQMHQVENVQIKLTADWQPDMEAIAKASAEDAKILFLCSPNNPTGNLMDEAKVLELLNTFEGLVVVDEAYLEFSQESSLLSRLGDFPRLIILQTFSKAWGLAAARVGVAYAHPRVVEWMNKVKPPYNLNELSQAMVRKAVGISGVMESRVAELNRLRESLRKHLLDTGIFVNVFPSDANFILVSSPKCSAIYDHLLSQGVVVRLRKGLPHCGSALRITVGTDQENKMLLEALGTFEA